MSAAEAVRELIGALLPPFVHIMHESTIAATSEQLGELAFTNAWTEGRFMTLEQVLAAKDPLPKHAQLPKRLSSVEPPIYSKLQVTSRSAATSYALQHQLL